jgi:uncharacterized protein YukE
MSRSGDLRNKRDLVTGGSIIDWVQVAQQVDAMGGLPGDPAGLRAVAATLRGGGNEINTVRQDLDAVRKGKLPRIWTGLSAMAAGAAVDALTNRMADVDQTFRDGASALERLADAIERTQRRDRNGNGAVQAAVAHASQVGPDEWPHIQENLLHGMDDMVGAAVDHENAALDAQMTLRGIADRATAGKMNTSSLSPIEKVLLAAADDGAGSILTAGDAAQASKNLNGWDFGSRMRLLELMETCVTDDERAWLMKSVAAGHNIDQITAFDATIRAHANDGVWMYTHLRPLDPNKAGSAAFMGTPLVQVDGTTCGSMCLVVNRAMRDPIYALRLSNVDPPQPPADEARIVADRIAAEEKKVLDTTSNNHPIMDWPGQWIGTHPHDAADYLSVNSGGIQYDWHRCVLTTADTADQVMSTVDAATAGNPSLLLIGNSYPDHYVMVVGETSNGVTVYNPATGQVVAMPAGDVTSEHLRAVSDRDTVYAVVTPTGG